MNNNAVFVIIAGNIGINMVMLGFMDSGIKTTIIAIGFCLIFNAIVWLVEGVKK